MTAPRSIRARPYPLGVTLNDGGANVAVFSAHATLIELCLFDQNDVETRVSLDQRDGHIWFTYVDGLAEGQRYGLRADGPWEPDAGHLFNPQKLLIDPYAREIIGSPDWAPALWPTSPEDSAPHMPKCVIRADRANETRPLRHPMSDTVIYEGHAKGLTMRHPGIQAQGRYEGLGEPDFVSYLKGLGITALELLPVQAFVDDPFIAERGLTNYWGYQTLGFFAAEQRYGDLDGLKSAVRTLHNAGIEVILDVVYNHTCEGDETGPSLCYRGLDNASYYRLDADGRALNDAGTGNTLNTQHPMVLRMIMDSLRYWVTEVGIDGFRFDLCTVLGRTSSGYDPNAPLLTAMRQDPVLNGIKLIAEPWDIGPGGYQLGGFPAPFSEWNDTFRDSARRFWRADPHSAKQMAAGLLGSAQQFDHSGRPATTSVNKITAHDGFTLHDLVSYSVRHNLANKEEGRDGHGQNYSDNMGHEGPTDDPAIAAARDHRKRALLATLMLAQGTPMLLAGDEVGHSQSGNNNAYCQDNETTWIDWAEGDSALHDYTTQLIALRRAYPLLRQTAFLHGEKLSTGEPNVTWLACDGGDLRSEDWDSPDLCAFCLVLRGEDAPSMLLAFNSGEECPVDLPSYSEWSLVFSSTDHTTQDLLPAQSISIFLQGSGT